MSKLTRLLVERVHESRAAESLKPTAIQLAALIQSALRAVPSSAPDAHDKDREWPGVQVEAVGSCVTGLSGPDSDIDLVAFGSRRLKSPNAMLAALRCASRRAWPSAGDARLAACACSWFIGICGIEALKSSADTSLH